MCYLLQTGAGHGNRTRQVQLPYEDARSLPSSWPFRFRQSSLSSVSIWQEPLVPFTSSNAANFVFALRQSARLDIGKSLVWILAASILYYNQTNDQNRRFLFFTPLQHLVHSEKATTSVGVSLLWVTLLWWGKRIDTVKKDFRVWL